MTRRSLFEPSFPGEVEIELPIFALHVWTPVLELRTCELIKAAQRRSDTVVEACVVWSGGCVYSTTPTSTFFGYPGLLPSVALEFAGKTRELVSAEYPGAVTMGVSVIGLAEHSHIHTRPWDHLADPELEDILTARIKFQEYDCYLKQG